MHTHHKTGHRSDDIRKTYLIVYLEGTPPGRAAAGRLTVSLADALLCVWQAVPSSPPKLYFISHPRAFLVAAPHR